MASVSDVYDKIVEANDRLGTVHNDLDQANTQLTTIIDVLQLFLTTLEKGFADVTSAQAVTNSSLHHLNRQTDTVICSLEHVSRNTCGIWTEANWQTPLQREMQAAAQGLLEISESVHADAALERRRLAGIRTELEECCPPEEPRPICTYEPCPAPPPPEEPHAREKPR
jgi:septation ring formation regulator EzrA